MGESLAALNPTICSFTGFSYNFIPRLFEIATVAREGQEAGTGNLGIKYVPNKYQACATTKVHEVGLVNICPFFPIALQCVSAGKAT